MVVNILVFSRHKSFSLKESPKKIKKKTLKYSAKNLQISLWYKNFKLFPLVTPIKIQTKRKKAAKRNKNTKIKDKLSEP